MMTKNILLVLLLVSVVVVSGCVGPGPEPKSKSTTSTKTQSDFPAYTKQISPCQPIETETDVVSLPNTKTDFTFSYPSSWSKEWNQYEALGNYYFKVADGYQLPGNPSLSISSNNALLKNPGSYESDPNPTLEKYLSYRLYEIEDGFGVTKNEVEVCSQKLGALDAYKLTYIVLGDAERPETSDWHYVDLVAVDEATGKIYSVFLKAQGPDFEEYLPDFESIAQSFEIK